MFGSEFDELILNLKKIPGITKKQAEKIAFYILDLNFSELEKITTSLINVNKNLNKCITCNFISKNKQCDFCLDPSRDKQLLILENNNEVLKIENSSIFKGKYFIYNIKDEKEIENNIKKIIDFSKNIDEIIISLSPTIEGLAATNLLISKLNKEINKKISKISFGIPIGSSIDYMDSLSIKESINNRKEVK
ncbi:toprim domain-containing protein [Mesomycoplasma molare]|uniref:Recombination protein RecR n=1 Tax=Mesomycoplasma molare TaxID=171288 RepID=A0ABY5TTD1_9BACT|nr:toprim domain-containing protein [Mesomycoplasma molare]UWD33935.1 toprim domain-containing protein [Mesomycoplasma molare]